MRPPPTFETQRANSDPFTFLASLPVCLTWQLPPQKPALLTQPEVTENDVSTLIHTREGAHWADGGPPLYGFPRKPETRPPETPAARPAAPDRKEGLVRMGGGGERISLSH